MNTPPIYLDHAATTPLDPVVFSAMKPYITSNFYNPSATYQAARLVKRDIESARASIAHYVGSRPSEIFFTAGGTEANNTIIHGIMSKFPDANCVISAIEHDSVINSAKRYDHRVVVTLADGRIDVENLNSLIDDTTVLVSVQYANNEIGTVQPIKELAAIIHEKRKQRQSSGNMLPIYLHTDACQTPAYLDIHAARLGVDAMTINASKIYGPKQIGALYIKAGIEIDPLIHGGGQERGVRSGTENVAAIIGFAAALSLVQDRRHAEIKQVKALQELFVAELQRINPSIVINGSNKYRLPNNVHITIPGIDNERVMIQLDDQGILCAVGSACNASSEEPSHVLTAIGLSDEAARSSLRFSFGHGTTESEIRRTVDVLAKLLD